MMRFHIDSGDTSPCIPGVVIENLPGFVLALSRRRRQHRERRQHAREQPPRNITLRAAATSSSAHVG